MKADQPGTKEDVEEFHNDMLAMNEAVAAFSNKWGVSYFLTTMIKPRGKWIYNTVCSHDIGTPKGEIEHKVQNHMIGAAISLEGTKEDNALCPFCGVDFLRRKLAFYRKIVSRIKESHKTVH